MSSNANLNWNGTQSNGPAQSWSTNPYGQPIGNGYSRANGNSMQPMTNGAPNYHHAPLPTGPPSGYQPNAATGNSGTTMNNANVGSYGHPPNMGPGNTPGPNMPGMSNGSYSTGANGPAQTVAPQIPTGNGSVAGASMHSQQQMAAAGQSLYGNSSAPIMSKQQSYQSMNGMPNPGNSASSHVPNGPVNASMSNTTANTTTPAPVSKPG